MEIVGVRRFVPEDPSELDGYRIAKARYVRDDPIPPEQQAEVQQLVQNIEDLSGRWLEKLARLSESRAEAYNFLQQVEKNPGTEDLERYSFWAVRQFFC